MRVTTCFHWEMKKLFQYYPLKPTLSGALLVSFKKLSSSLQGDIVKAYRKLARKWHPDMHRGEVYV